MKEKKKPDRLELEAIRNQILDFACAKHDFKLESEHFPFDGNWKRTSYIARRRWVNILSDLGWIWKSMNRSGSRNMKMFAGRLQDMTWQFTLPTCQKAGNDIVVYP